MKIEKPDWYKLTHSKVYPFEVLDQWFKENVEPVNSMLEDGIEMLGDAEDFSCGSWVRRNGQTSTDRTHSGLLINIQEIKPKTKGERAIELLRDMLECENLESYHWEQCEALLKETESHE